MQATQMSDNVKMVVLDKTFDSIRGGSANVVRNGLRNSPLLRNLLPAAVIRGLIGESFPIGVPVLGVTDKNGNPVATDGCNNVQKAKEYTGLLVCIEGKQDETMGYEWKKEEIGDEPPRDICQQTLSSSITDARRGIAQQENTFSCFTDQEHTPQLNQESQTFILEHIQKFA